MQYILNKYGSSRSFPEMCMDGLAALAANGYATHKGEGRILCYLPEDKNNPFQNMLYSQSIENGFACFPINSMDDIVRMPDGLKLVLHIHWVHRVFDELHTRAEAKAATWQYLHQIETAQDEGHKVVWTVHNKLAHSSNFPAEEYHLRKMLAERVDVIHLMNPASRAICQPEYDLPPEKTIVVEHPSYKGVYSDYISKSAARFQLGIAEEEKVFLMFGKMVPQKGARNFLAHMDEIQREFKGLARFLLVGRESTSEFTEEMIALTAGRADVMSVRSFIADQDVQLYFRAADVVVCPYRRGLNSGVALTAATFGKPVLTSRAVAQIFKDVPELVVAIDTARMENVAQACMKAVKLAADDATETAIMAWANEREPHVISENFFVALREHL